MQSHLVSRGFEAVELLKHEKFNILVTDFQMPGFDCVELLAWCRNNYVHVPVVFMSATADLVDREKTPSKTVAQFY